MFLQINLSDSPDKEINDTQETIEPIEKEYRKFTLNMPTKDFFEVENIDPYQLYECYMVPGEELENYGLKDVNFRVQIRKIYKGYRIPLKDRVFDTKAINIDSNDINPKSIIPSKPGRHKKKSEPFGKESRAILLKWLNDHQSMPYPDTKELIELSNETNLSPKQVRTFLVNYRMRFLKRNPKNGQINQNMRVDI